MTFAHPVVLLLLAIPVVLGMWVVQHRGTPLVMPVDHLPHVRRRFTRLWLALFELVPSLLLAAAIVLLAGPQTLRQPRQERLLTNIQFCLDVSGSMTAEDRYDLAAEAIEDFTTARKGDAFGLTIFGSQQVRWTPLTKDLDAIRQALPFANPQWQPMHMSGTRIGAALLFARDNMMHEATEGDRMIVLVSDGYSSDLGDGFAEVDVASALRDAKITVFHVHVASTDIPPEVVDIARQTGGDAFQATDRQGLATIFRHIDRMKPAQFKPGGTILMDHLRPAALAGLAALALHLVGLCGWRYTPW